MVPPTDDANELPKQLVVLRGPIRKVGREAKSEESPPPGPPQGPENGLTNPRRETSAPNSLYLQKASHQLANAVPGDDITMRMGCVCE